MSYPQLLEQLINHLTKLPGVGRRSAERMVFWFLHNSRADAEQLANTLVRVKSELELCRICNHLGESDVCAVCRDMRRDRTTICVVEEHKHLIAIERTGTYKGLYHVLLGAMAPQEGRGPEDLKIEKLVERVKTEGIQEVVIATDPDTEGEMTALHIINQLKPLGIKVGRIGLGIPVGGSVEYADLSTLTMSMTARRQI